MLRNDDYDIFLLRQADRHIDPRSYEDDYTPSRKEMLDAIAEEYGIDTSDWYGKYLVLQILLSHAPKDEANSIVEDTISLIDDDIVEAAFREAGYDD